MGGDGHDSGGTVNGGAGVEGINSGIKRAFDLGLSLAGLIISLPLMVVLALLVKVSSAGPVFYRQDRVGQNGRLFSVAKFRSMYPRSDREGSITTATDARITPIGRFLRNNKLDELPQLWNILLGRMSFVGPRPDVPGYADGLVGDDRRVLLLRPGLTGPATLYFRDEEAILAAVDDPREYNDRVIYPKKVAINLQYMESWSFRKDLGYILITVLPALDRWLHLMPEGNAAKTPGDGERRKGAD